MTCFGLSSLHSRSATRIFCEKLKDLNHIYVVSQFHRSLLVENQRSNLITSILLRVAKWRWYGRFTYLCGTKLTDGDPSTYGRPRQKCAGWRQLKTSTGAGTISRHRSCVVDGGGQSAHWAKVYTWVLERIWKRRTSSVKHVLTLYRSPDLNLWNMAKVGWLTGYVKI